MTVARKKEVLLDEVAKNETVFEFKGDVYTIPDSKEWDIDVVRAQELGQVITFVEGLLGEEQWKKFRKKSSKMGDIEDLATAMFSAVGADPKE